MASVPNTTNFSLTDVTAIVGGTSLTTAFTNSIDSYFDINYKGSKDRLSNFRNYGSTTVLAPEYFNMVQEVAFVDTVTSVEISNSGTNLYLLFPELKKIRKYSLSTPFDISTMSLSQEYDLSQWGVDISCSSLFLSPDEKDMTFLDYYNVRTIHFTVPNDLSTDAYLTTFTIPSADMSAGVGSVSFDSTGTLMTVIGAMLSGQRRSRTYQVNTPFQTGAPVTYLGLATYNALQTTPRGLEWSSDGTTLYTLDPITSYLYMFPIGPTPYYPNEVGLNPVKSPSLSSPQRSYYDFCFNNNWTKMYAIVHLTSGSLTWNVVEFNAS